MKLRVTKRERLVHTLRETPEGAVFRPSGAPSEEKRQALYNAIEATRAFLHRSEPTEDFMEDLRRRYPAPRYFLESSSQTLELAGLSRSDAFYYSLIPALTRTGLSQQWGANPRLDSLAQIRDYLRALYVGVHVECCYLIMLDRQGRLLRPELLQRGAVDNAPFYLGQVLTAALREDARFLVLAHNHPGGTRRPSREDLICTLRTLNAFQSLRVPLLDHVIVVDDDVVSIRQTGLIPAMLWQAALPGNRIVEDWLGENLK